MQGRTKVAGNTGALLDLLAAARGPVYDACRAEVAAASLADD
jgi:hypothetical protein